MSGLPLLVSNSIAAATTTYIDDVFGTYLYKATGATQSIVNGIDLAGKGGLVWIKGRTNTEGHVLMDTVRGTTKHLKTQSANGEATFTDLITSYNSNGFTLGPDASSVGLTNNGTTINFASWTFRKAAKFFDIVTYTGNGTTQTLPHSLGIVPGAVVVKKLSGVSGVGWDVWHRSLVSGNHVWLNKTDASSAGGITVWGNNAAVVDPTSTNFTVGQNADLNENGSTYVAYLFAHDPAADGLIQCGTFTTDASGVATVNLGWETQFLLVKRVDTTGSWLMMDTARGFSLSTTDASLSAETLSVESTAQQRGEPTSTGFYIPSNYGVNATYIYIAIRRSNKPPTSGTQVYKALAISGNSSTNRTLSGVGFSPDSALCLNRFGGWISQLGDRLRGATKSSSTSQTNAEITYTNGFLSYDMDGVTIGDQGANNETGSTYVYQFFKRAVGVFDVVCWTGDGTNNLRSHGLGVKPELLIMKRLDAASDWEVGCLTATTDYAARLNTTAAAASGATGTLSVGTNASVFSATLYTPFYASGGRYVAYLFATRAGVSKVGTYVGNNTTLNVDCGFAAGARFVMIRRVNGGDWFVWDSVRGIVAANDPHLSLNTTVAEITSDDSIDPFASGFTVNQVSGIDINLTADTYIYLAFA